MACAYLSKLRTDERLAKQREANAWKNKYGDKPRERNANKNITPFLCLRILLFSFDIRISTLSDESKGVIF